jgi:hypothetical protein
MSAPDSAWALSVRQARERWRLPWQGKRWRGGSGGFLGRGTGGALDFEDHRPYAPGDDLRHLNWAVYGRTGVHTLKVFRPEVSPLLDVVVDVSTSMGITSEKDACVRSLASWAVDSGRADGASVRIWECGARRVQPVETGAVFDLRWESAEGGAPTAPVWESVLWRSGGMRVLISDLLWPGDPGPVLDAFARGAGQAVLFVPFAAEEAEPLWEGNVDLRDCESTQRRVICVDGAVLRTYRRAYSAHFALWEEAAHQRQIAFARIPAAGDLAVSMGRFALPAGAVEAAG